MRLRALIPLMVLIASAWLAWRWIEKAESVRRPPVGLALLSFDISTISEIQLRRAEAAANIKPINGVWHFTSPVKDRIDQNAVLALYLGLKEMTLCDIITKEEMRRNDRMLEEFGLGRKAVTVRLLDPLSQPFHEFRIGHLTQWQSEGIPTMYIQWRSGPNPEDVLVVSGNIRELLDRPFDAMRTRKALFLPRPPLSITLQSGPEILELQRNTPDSPWVILRPMRERADSAAVSSLLRGLSDTDVISLIPRESSSWQGNEVARLRISMDSPDLGKSNPSATTPPVPTQSSLDLDTESKTINAAFSLLSASGSPSVLSRWSDRRFDLGLPANVLDQIKPSLDRFRSRSLADFHFPEVTRFLIRAPGETTPPVVLSNIENNWQVFLRDSWLPADANRIQLAIEAIAACPILSFPTDAPKNLADYGLDLPFLQVAIYLSSESQQNLDLGVKDGKYFARFQDRPSVYEIPESVQSFLPASPAAWRARPLFTFLASDLRQIVLSLPQRPEIALSYNPEENTWLALTDGEDKSDDIDSAAAANLASTIERLTASRWLANSSETISNAFKNPLASILLTVAPQDAESLDAPNTRIRLHFAQSTDTSPFLYGNFEGQPDIFLINRSILDDLGDTLFFATP